MLDTIKITFYILIFFCFSCDMILKNNNTDKVEDTELEEKESTFVKNQYVDEFNAETNHWFTYPKSFKYIQNEYGDTIYIHNSDSSLLVKKWYDLEVYPNNYYQLDKYGDLLIDSIDNNEIKELFSSSINSFILECRDGMLEEKVDIRAYEANLLHKKNDCKVSTKILLCDVVGGTHVITYLEIKYLQSDINNNLVYKMNNGFKRNFIIKD